MRHLTLMEKTIRVTIVSIRIFVSMTNVSAHLIADTLRGSHPAIPVMHPHAPSLVSQIVVVVHKAKFATRTPVVVVALNPFVVVTRQQQG